MMVTALLVQPTWDLTTTILSQANLFLVSQTSHNDSLNGLCIRSTASGHFVANVFIMVPGL